MMALRARMTLWRRIWIMATLGERATVMLAGAAGMLIVAAVGAWFGQTDTVDPLRKACLLGGTPIAAVAVLWWATFCGGAARQNSPANAALVPKLNRAVRQCVALVWVLTMLALLPLVWKHPDGAAVYPQFALALTGFGLYRAGRQDGLVVVAAIILLYLVGLALPSLTMFLVHPVGVSIASLLAIGYAAWALPRALPAGGDRHWDMRSKQQLARAQNDMVEWDKAKRSGGRRLRVHAWVLAHDIDKGSQADMLLHGLGPGNHRYHAMLGMACVAGLFLIARAVLALLGIPAPDLTGLGGTLAAVGVLMLLTLSWSRFGISIRGTPLEQSVLRMVPAMPAGPVLNRVLGRRILVISLREWLFATAIVLGMVWLWDGTWANLRVALTLAAAMLAATAISLEDFAHKPITKIGSNFWPSVVMAGGIFFGFAYRGDIGLWGAVLALQLAASLTDIALRWRQMQSAPAAFPAGRIGK